MVDMKNKMIKKISEIINVIKRFFSNKKDMFLKFLEDRKNNKKYKTDDQKKLKKIFNKILLFLKKAFNTIKQFFIKTFNNIKNLITKIVKKISIFLSERKKKKTEEISIEKELKLINKNISNLENKLEPEKKLSKIKIIKKHFIKKLTQLKELKTRKKEINDDSFMLSNIKDKLHDCENKISKINKTTKKTNIKEKTNNIKIIKMNSEKSDNKKVIKIKPKKSDKKTSKIKTEKPSILFLLTMKKILNNFKKGLIIIKTKFVLFVIAIIKIFKNMKKNIIILFVGNKFIKKKIVTKKIKKIKKQEIQDLENKLIYINNQINDTYKKIDKIISSKYSESKELELLVLKDNVLDLKKDYYYFSKNSKFSNLKLLKKIDQIDLNHLCYHDKNIDNLIDYIDFHIKELKNETKEKQNKLINNKFIVEEKEINLINTSINKDIDISKMEVDKIKQLIKKTNPNYRKKVLTTNVIDFFKNSINIGMSLIPVEIFKNKLFVTLTSCIILNNRIHYMRYLISNKNEEVELINYEKILRTISNKKDCLKETNLILLETIKEVTYLKDEIETEYKYKLDKYPEVAKLLLELEEMTNDLKEENSSIEKQIRELKIEKVTV